MAPFGNLGEQFDQLPYWQKVLLAAVGVILLGLVAAYFLLWPRWQEIKTLRQEIEAERAKLAQVQQTRARIAQFKRELAEMETRFEQIKIMLPEAKEIPGLLKTVSNLGLQQGLEFLLFKPEKENLQEFVAEIPVTLHIKGTYHQMGVFFDRLRRLPRIVNIKQLELGAYEEKSSKITGRCQLITFRVLPYTPPKAGAKAGTGKQK